MEPNKANEKEMGQNMRPIVLPPISLTQNSRNIVIQRGVQSPYLQERSFQLDGNGSDKSDLLAKTRVGVLKKCFKCTC